MPLNGPRLQNEAICCWLAATADLIAGEDGRDGIDSTRERLAEHEHVGLDIPVLARKHLAGARESGLKKKGPV